MHTPRDKTQRRPNCNRRTLREKARETAARRRRRRPVNEQSSPACMQSRLFRDSIHAPRAGSRPTHAFLTLYTTTITTTTYEILHCATNKFISVQKTKGENASLFFTIAHHHRPPLLCVLFGSFSGGGEVRGGEGPKCVAKARFFLARRCAIQKGLVARPRPPPMGSFSVFSSPR